jgi:hypothetical protein
MLDFQKILLSTKKPPIFEPGDSCIWTERYISGQMLAAHLNPDYSLETLTPIVEAAGFDVETA